MKTKYILLLIISVFLSGCRDNSAQTTESHAEEQTVDTERTTWENDIELNNGSQWLVRKTTTEGVERMTEIIEKDSSKSIEEYRELGNMLDGEQNKWERHTEHAPSTKNLEIYLAPLDEKIEQLRKARTPEEGANLKSHLKQHLEKYSQYFIQTGMDITQ